MNAITATNPPPAPRTPRAKASGNVKATREDWLATAHAVLVSGGVGEVKVLTLSSRLGVSRSSFYWYFKSREDLLDALLARWEGRNTGAILTACTRPSKTITEAVCNLFRGFLDVDQFDPRLDFAVREWARRSATVRSVIDRSDTRRIEAIAGLFLAHGFADAEADIRARVLYFQQIGYYALELREPFETRLARVPDYLHAFTGTRPNAEEVEALADDVRRAIKQTETARTNQ
ncbi:MAG: TetR/AcrR family transcriptional regulator [Pseudomonadota bacterium]